MIKEIDKTLDELDEMVSDKELTLTMGVKIRSLLAKANRLYEQVSVQRISNKKAHQEILDALNKNIEYIKQR